MKYTLKQLSAFVAVGRERSFTRAAKSLSTSQPSVSASIQQLEANLNQRLFDRTTKELHLTKQGEAYLPTIERLLADLELTMEELRTSASGNAGSIAISVLPSVAANVLPATITEFSRTNPGVRILLRDDNTTGVHECVRRGEVDLGVAGNIKDTEELVFQRLITDQVGVVVHASHSLAAETGPLDWQDLAGFPFITLASDTGIRPLLDTLKDVPSNVASPRTEVSNIATVLALLRANFGIAALPQMAVHSEQNDLVFRVLLNPPLFRELDLITRAKRTLSPAAQSFVNHLKATLQPKWLR